MKTIENAFLWSTNILNPTIIILISTLECLLKGQIMKLKSKIPFKFIVVGIGISVVAGLNLLFINATNNQLSEQVTMADFAPNSAGIYRAHLNNLRSIDYDQYMEVGYRATQDAAAELALALKSELGSQNVSYSGTKITLLNAPGVLGGAIRASTNRGSPVTIDLGIEFNEFGKQKDPEKRQLESGGQSYRDASIRLSGESFFDVDPNNLKQSNLVLAHEMVHAKVDRDIINGRRNVFGFWVENPTSVFGTPTDYGNFRADELLAHTGQLRAAEAAGRGRQAEGDATAGALDKHYNISRRNVEFGLNMLKAAEEMNLAFKTGEFEYGKASSASTPDYKGTFVSVPGTGSLFLPDVPPNTPKEQIAKEAQSMIGMAKGKTQVLLEENLERAERLRGDKVRGEKFREELSQAIDEFSARNMDSHALLRLKPDNADFFGKGAYAGARVQQDVNQLRDASPTGLPSDAVTNPQGQALNQVSKDIIDDLDTHAPPAQQTNAVADKLAMSPTNEKIVVRGGLAALAPAVLAGAIEGTTGLMNAENKAQFLREGMKRIYNGIIEGAPEAVAETMVLAGGAKAAALMIAGNSAAMVTSGAAILAAGAGYVGFQTGSVFVQGSAKLCQTIKEGCLQGVQKESEELSQKFSIGELAKKVFKNDGAEPEEAEKAGERASQYHETATLAAKVTDGQKVSVSELKKLAEQTRGSGNDDLHNVVNVMQARQVVAAVMNGGASGSGSSPTGTMSISVGPGTGFGSGSGSGSGSSSGSGSGSGSGIGGSFGSNSMNNVAAIEVQRQAQVELNGAFNQLQQNAANNFAPGASNSLGNGPAGDFAFTTIYLHNATTGAVETRFGSQWEDKGTGLIHVVYSDLANGQAEHALYSSQAVYQADIDDYTNKFLGSSIIDLNHTEVPF